MTEAVFVKSGDGFTSVSVGGHAGYAGKGADIVCAAVSSAVQLTANGITEALNVRADVIVSGDSVKIALPDNPDPAAQAFLKALFIHLSVLSGDYGEYIKITVMEA